MIKITLNSRCTLINAISKTNKPGDAKIQKVSFSSVLWISCIFQIKCSVGMNNRPWQHQWLCGNFQILYPCQARFRQESRHLHKVHCCMWMLPQQNPPKHLKRICFLSSVYFTPTADSSSHWFPKVTAFLQTYQSVTLDSDYIPKSDSSMDGFDEDDNWLLELDDEGRGRKWHSVGMWKSPENKKKETRQCTNLKSHSSGGVPHRPWRNVDSEKGQVHLGFASVYLPSSSSTLLWSCTR